MTTVENPDPQQLQNWERRKKFRDWFAVTERLHAAVVNFYAKDSQSILDSPDERMVRDNVKRAEATAIGSSVIGYDGFHTGRHQILMDLDGPHVYQPSTTEGHGHLIFRKQVSWTKYLKFLDACVDVGIVEPGYRDAAKHRKEAWLRTPWTPKGPEGNVDDGYEARFNPVTGYYETMVSLPPPSE